LWPPTTVEKLDRPVGLDLVHGGMVAIDTVKHH
jgi:hypothetical protein